ncbi:hypothetical protein ACWCXL_21535, partial [Streptomyces sp. NPDC001588]
MASGGCRGRVLSADHVAALRPCPGSRSAAPRGIPAYTGSVRWTTRGRQRHGDRTGYAGGRRHLGTLRAHGPWFGGHDEYGLRLAERPGRPLPVGAPRARARA